MDTTPIGLSDLASTELAAAADAIVAGDEEAARWARDIRQQVTAVNDASRKALAEAARLHADDVMNPVGKERQLAALPRNLIGATSAQLDDAESYLQVVEALHLGSILRHDSRNDANLRAELDNYIAGIVPETAASTLVGLAADVRYSTYMAGPMGKSLAARFGLDPEIFRKVALEALAVEGTEDQVRRSTALASIGKMRRVIGLARGGRDHAANEVGRAPRPASTEALR